jgi:hypothetical protein
MRALGTLTAAALALLLSSGRPCQADVPPAPPVQAAGEHFARGVRLYEEQDWRAALIEFERAVTLAPRFEVLYNVAQCHYQLQDYAGALRAFERYLTDGGGQIEADERARVETTIEDLRGRVAQVRVETNVSGAEITVDDVVVGTTPLSEALLVSEGRRRVAASKPGFVPFSRFVDLAGRDTTAVNLVLAPIAMPTAAPAAAAAPPPATPSPPTPPRGTRSVAPGLVALGIGAVGVGVGAAFGLVAVDNRNDLDRMCSDRACPPAAQGQISALQRDAVISTVGFAVGAAGVAAGAAWLLFAPGRGRTDSPGPSGRVHPVLAPGFVGATGSF